MHLSTCKHVEFKTGEQIKAEKPMSTKPITSIRLTKSEQKTLETKYFEIANARLEKGLKSIEESEIIHQVLEIALPKAKVGKNGQITIEE